jgi:anti-anti-sigma factor
MAGQAVGARITPGGNVVAVRGDLGPEQESEYAETLFRLLKSGNKRLVVDLTGLGHMSSSYVGSTCLLSRVADRENRTVVVKAGMRVGQLPTMAGLGALTTVEIGGGA